jgi:ketosteroid isomerase-like protein
MNREDNQQLIIDYFKAFESLESNQLGNFIAEDISFSLPYSPEWFHKQINGKEKVIEVLSGVIDSAQSMRFKLDIKPLLDPKQFIVIFDGEVLFKNGTQYNNHYINLFTISAGKISAIVEYFNPYIVAASFRPDNI